MSIFKRKATSTDPEEDQIYQTTQAILAILNQVNGKATTIMAAQDDILQATQVMTQAVSTIQTVVAAIQQSVTDIKAWEAAHSTTVDTTDLVAATQPLTDALTTLTGEQADVASADLQSPPAQP